MARTGLIMLLLGAGLAGACAGHVPGVPSVPMEAALERATAATRVSLTESLRAALQGPGTFGTGQPAAPVLVPPDVRRVWVPTHENAEGALIAGHWVFLRVRDFRWHALFFACLFVNFGEAVFFAVGGPGLFLWPLICISLHPALAPPTDSRPI